MADALPGPAGETPHERLNRNWNDVLQELRVTQTGTQILSGFLLAVAFQPRFTEMDAWQLALYLALVALAALSTALGLAPVIVHRRFFRQGLKSRIVGLGDRFLIAQLVVVGLLASGVTSLIFDFVLGRAAGLIAGSGALAVVAMLWLLVPRAARDR